MPRPPPLFLHDAVAVGATENTALPVLKWKRPKKEKNKKQKQRLLNILKSYLPVIYANKYLYMRKNTPVYCRLNLYENLRELMRIKVQHLLSVWKKKKYIKVFYNNNFDKVCVVPCCLFLSGFFSISCLKPTILECIATKRDKVVQILSVTSRVLCIGYGLFPLRSPRSELWFCQPDIECSS